MKAEELRIGNLVYAETGLPSLEVHTVMAGDIPDIDSGRAKIEPIPLTEEWLDIKFFLEEIETGYWQLTEDVIISTEGQCYAVDDLDNRVWIAEIFKVHQLQNLYFALTGEELVIEHGI